jgi:hypothetical protein
VLHDWQQWSSFNFFLRQKNNCKAEDKKVNESVSSLFFPVGCDLDSFYQPCWLWLMQ